MMNYFIRRWSAEAGYREVLAVAVPLILSTGAWSIQHVVDRIFLTWYSAGMVAAAMPSGILNFTIMSLFIGTVSYTGTFVAQYYGAGREQRIGAAAWQGLYVAAAAFLVQICLIPFARDIFGLFGHGYEITAYETAYFITLCLGGFPAAGAAALGGFYSGLSRTWTIMWVNVAATILNMVLDYLLIFGKYGFPELGITGAGIATVAASSLAFCLYVYFITRPENDRKYGTRRSWLPDRELFSRLIVYGLPGGIQFFVDISGFTFFVLLVGRLGPRYLAATTISLNINSFAFMPMIGMGIALSVLVGQYIGREKPGLAEKAVYSGFHLTVLYMGTWAVLYILIPSLLLLPYEAGADMNSWIPIRGTILILLRFVALYSIFDTMNIVFASGLKGAGDTRFIMKMLFFTSLLTLVIPTYIALEVLNRGIYAAWGIASFYIILLGFIFLARFRHGKWKTMKVIEDMPPVVPPNMPDAPGEFEL